jgi:Homeodomain-like domain
LIRFLERAMPKPYSVDLRARVIEDVETGASRREAAERYGISPSVVVIWVQRFEETGSLQQSQAAAVLAAGAARGVSAGSDCQPAGPDAGRDRRGDAQTPDRRQPQRGVAVFRSPQHRLQKNSDAVEQKRADVARARRR